MHQSEIGVVSKERVERMQTWICDRREEKIERDEQNDSALFLARVWGYVRLVVGCLMSSRDVDASGVRIDVGWGYT